MSPTPVTPPEPEKPDTDAPADAPGAKDAAGASNAPPPSNAPPTPSNAADACDKKRFLALTEKTEHNDELEVRIRCDKDGKKLIIEDTGVGMSKEVQSRIFEPFFTTKAAGEGTGMGLAAVYGTISAHGGSIDCQSEPGQGTTFRILLPCCLDDTGVAPAVAPAYAAASSPTTILIVDDEEDVGYALEAMLRRMQYRCLLYQSAAEAVAYFRQHHAEIDLVLLDMVMPDLDGAQGHAAIRAEYPALPILVVSGYAHTESIQRLESDPHTGFLRKPYRKDGLARAVASLLDA